MISLAVTEMPIRDIEIFLLIGTDAGKKGINIQRNFSIYNVSPDVYGYVRVAILTDIDFSCFAQMLDADVILPKTIDVPLHPIQISKTKYVFWGYCKENNILYYQERTI